MAALATATLGGVGVVISYVLALRNEPPGAYTESRLWVGIPAQTAQALVPLQLVAAVGYIVFTAEVTGLSHWLGLRDGSHKKPERGLFKHDHVLPACFAVFSVASMAWPWLAVAYADAKGTSSARSLALSAAFSLILAAVSAICMVAGAFEADQSQFAVLGVLAFATVVVLADGVGWNARLLVVALSAETIVTRHPTKTAHTTPPRRRPLRMAVQAS